MVYLYKTLVELRAELQAAEHRVDQLMREYQLATEQCNSHLTVIWRCSMVVYRMLYKRFVNLTVS